MKQFLTIFLSLIALNSFSQAIDNIDSILFCSSKYKVPTGCSIEGATKVLCPNGTTEWSYTDKDKLKPLKQSYFMMANMLKDFKKKKVTCLLLGKKMEGYKVSYANKTGRTNQFYVSGIVSNQPVIIILTLNKELISNADLPEFASQFIQLPE